jgi:hypothetical protein
MAEMAEIAHCEPDCPIARMSSPLTCPYSGEPINHGLKEAAMMRAEVWGKSWSDFMLETVYV